MYYRNTTCFFNSQNLPVPTPNSHGVTVPLISLYDPHSISNNKRPKDIADTVTACSKVATIPADEEFLYGEATDNFVDSGLYEATFEIPLVPERGLAEDVFSPLCTVAGGYLLERYGAARKALLEFSSKGAGLEFNAVVHEYIPDSSVTLFLIPEDLTKGELEDWGREVVPVDPYGTGSIFIEHLEDNEDYESLPESALLEDGLENFRQPFSYENSDLYPYECAVYWGKIIVGENTYLIVTHAMSD